MHKYPSSDEWNQSRWSLTKRSSELPDHWSDIKPKFWYWHFLHTRHTKDDNTVTNKCHEMREWQFLRTLYNYERKIWICPTLFYSRHRSQEISDMFSTASLFEHQWLLTVPLRLTMTHAPFYPRGVCTSVANPHFLKQEYFIGLQHADSVFSVR
jgi:hypothetical protein